MKSLSVCFVILLSAHLCAQTRPAQIRHPEGRYVLVNGAKLWVEIEGRGDPILLIPGGPGNSHTYFHPWFSELAKRYQVIYFDAFGRGKSDRSKNPSDYSFQRDVEDIELLRKELKFEHWTLLGHSYGGMVAQAYALKYPASVDKLILSDSFYSGEMWQANNDNCNAELRNQFPELWDTLRSLRAAGFNSSSPKHQRAYALPSGLLYFYDASNVSKGTTDSLIMNTDVYYQLVGADGDFIIGGDVARLDFRRDLRKLKMPVLIIEGRYDRVAIPGFSILFKRYAPQASFVMFEKSGHHPYLEETENYFSMVNDFLVLGK